MKRPRFHVLVAMTALCVLVAPRTAGAQILALWEFDTDLFTDSSISGLHLTDDGSTVGHVPGVSGMAASFSGGTGNGNNDPGVSHLETLAASPATDFGGGFSIVLWAYPEQLPANAPSSGLAPGVPLISHHATGLNNAAELFNGFLLAIYSDGAFGVYLDSATSISLPDGPLLFVSDPGLVAPDQWTHLAFTWDGSINAGGHLYVDGEPIATDVRFETNNPFVGLDTTGELPIRLGAGFIDTSGTFRGFAGLLDHVSVWMGALTPGQVEADFDDTANQPPVACAGSDQDIRAGDLVQLDGSCSFDDNTASANLVYQWQFVESPLPQPDLLGADTSSPSFVADTEGTYVLHLVVADQDGLVSPPDVVVISSDNLAPTAVAATDADIYLVGDIALLDGTDSSDPEGDALAYEWALARPANSNAAIADPSAAMTTLLLDVEGLYEITLTVSDWIGPGPGDTVQVVAVTAEDLAVSHILNASDLLSSLGPGQVTSKGNQNAMGNFLQQAIAAIQAGDIAEAIAKLEHTRSRTDGCVLRGAPDGNGPGRDWITDCAAQAELYDELTLAIDALT